MSKGSAIISILIAFVAGLAIGHLVAQDGSGEGEHLAEIGMEERGGGAGAAERAPAPADGVERFRAEVPENAPQRGPDDALVTIVMWSDFQCPFCSRVEPTLSRIVNEFGNDVRIVWRDNALPFHQNALPAASAAREAYAQGGNEKFWEMHDLLYAKQNEWKASRSPERLVNGYAAELGLNADEFASCYREDRGAGRTAINNRAADALRVRATPSFFVNGRLVEGALPAEQFRQLLGAMAGGR